MSFSKAVPEDDSDLQVPPSESEKTPCYVATKIKSKNRPNRGSRARKAWRGSLAKVIKKTASIAELLTEDDQQENLRVIREAKSATHRVFNFETKKTEEVPDHKTRLAAITLELAYTEGRPVERQMSVSGKFEDLAALQERLKHSPAFQQIMAERSLQNGPNVLPEIPALEKSD
jgi:hypothetical protein